jgi:hypothetical protein
MIDAPDSFKQAFKNSDVRNLIYKVTIMRNTEPTEIDITDRVKDIEITRDLDSANATCKLTIDNSDFQLSINNKDSNYNLCRGAYDPLLYPNHIVKVYAGLGETSTENGASVYIDKSATINNFSEAEFYNTEPIQDGIMLSYTLGQEYLLQSQETITSYNDWGKRYYTSGYDEYQWGQILRLNGTVKKKISRFSVMILAASSKLYYGQGSLQCYLKKWSWDGTYWNSHDNPGPPPFSIGGSISSNIITNRVDGWIDFKFNDAYLEPNTDYIFYLFTTAQITKRDKYLNLDRIGINDNAPGYKRYYEFENEVVTQQHQQLDKSLAFRLYVRDIIYKNEGYAVVRFDCGPNVSEYISLSGIYSGSSVSFEFSSSIDNINWSAWYQDLQQVPVARYLKVKIKLSTTDTLYSPIVNSITLNYRVLISASPDGMVQIFTGITGDDIEEDANNGLILVGCRDFSKCLQDVYVSLSKSYDYKLVEDIISDLIKTYLPQSAIYSVLGDIDFVYEPTFYMIQHYQLKNINLWEGLQQLSDLMGWYLMFDESGVLRLFSRKKQSVADDIFDEDYIVMETLNLSDADIRNDILVKAEQPSGIIQVEVKDEDSIREFGRRFMEVDRSLTSYIYDHQSAQNLANAILEDLHSLRSKDVITLPFYPFIQLGDIIGINSNRVSLSSDEQLYKVIGITHTLNETSKQTVIQTQLFKNLWETVSFTPSAPTNLTTEIVSRTIKQYPGCGWNDPQRTFYYPRLTWSIPTTNTDGSPIEGLTGFNIYRSTDNANYVFIAFVPAKLSGVDTNVNWFIDYGSGPGTFYYRISAINKWNKKSPYSDTVTITVPNFSVG